MPTEWFVKGSAWQGKSEVSAWWWNVWITSIKYFSHCIQLVSNNPLSRLVFHTQASKLSGYVSSLPQTNSWRSSGLLRTIVFVVSTKHEWKSRIGYQQAREQNYRMIEADRLISARYCHRADGIHVSFDVQIMAPSFELLALRKDYWIWGKK